MKLKSCPLFLVISLSVLAFSCGQKLPEEKTLRTITVSGNSQVKTVPDFVNITFSVKTIDRSVTAATENNALYTNNALSALKEAGINSNDISTNDYRISQPTYGDYAGRYIVQNSITVQVRNPDNAGKVIDSAIGPTKANGIDEYYYTIKDNDEVLRQARSNAVQNAYETANLYASVSGCKVGKVISIYEYDGYYSSSPAGMRATPPVYADLAVTQTPINANMCVSAKVDITYELTD